MKVMILTALVAMSLGIGFAHAQSVPAGYHLPHYGRF
jgi:hypothetical protein